MNIRKTWVLGAALVLAGGVAVAQTAFPLVSAVTGGMILKNEASPTYSYMTVDQVGTYLHTPATAGLTGQLLQGVTSGAPAWATALTGDYTLSGSNTFSGPLNFFSSPLVQFGRGSTVTPVHVQTAQATAPALTSCGTGSPAITGTDTAGIVTMGTSATGCVITFNVAYTSAPYCVVSWIATPLASQSYVTSNVAITLTQTSTSGNKVQYVCLAPAGG